MEIKIQNAVLLNFLLCFHQNINTDKKYFLQLISILELFLKDHG